MLIKDGFFTSESVSDGHPDKICDQISDAILDACLSQNPASRVAIEAAIKGCTICLLGEITTSAQLDLRAIATGVLANIGHVDGKWGLDPGDLTFVEDVTMQSPEIKAGVDGDDTGAGDQGLMFGFACDETPNLMPLPIDLAHALMRRHREYRRSPDGAAIGPDAKAQVTIRYADGRPVALDTVVLSTQHSADLPLDDLRAIVRRELLEPVIGSWLTSTTRIHINPAGTFVHGGPAADAGLTGRKIIVDTYGGYARHGGGAFSGKDATKVDRSGAYAARQLARDVVARGWAKACEVRVAYAIGLAAPIDVSFETFGTSDGADPALLYRNEGIDVRDLMRPRSILARLDLQRPVFGETAAFGHFGRSEFAWEQPIVDSKTQRHNQGTYVMSPSRFPWLSNIIYPVAVLFILSLPIGGWKVVTGFYHSIFSISINDTVEDYMKAPIDQVVRLHMNGFCNNGTCITKSDWACGFITETWKFDHDEFSSFSEALDDCVRKLIRTSAKESKLETIATICGRHYMTFDPRSTGATPEHCEKAGGVWGVKTPVWADEKYLLTVIGVH